MRIKGFGVVKSTIRRNVGNGPGTDPDRVDAVRHDQSVGALSRHYSRHHNMRIKGFLGVICAFGRTGTDRGGSQFGSGKLSSRRSTVRVITADHESRGFHVSECESEHGIQDQTEPAGSGRPSKPV